MKALILGALGEEVEGICSALTGAQKRKIGAFEVMQGRLGDGELIVCRCGVGKVNASAAASAILACEGGIELVINTGVAGGIGCGVRRGDVVLGTKTVHHDYDQTPDGLKKGQVQGFDSEFFICDEAAASKMKEALSAEGIRYIRGIIASGDQFIASKQKAASIHKEFGAAACDCESAPIAQVCSLYGVPCLIMRAISDGGDDDAVKSFYEFLTKAANNNIRGIKRFFGATC